MLTRRFALVPGPAIPDAMPQTGFPMVCAGSPRDVLLAADTTTDEAQQRLHGFLEKRTGART